MDANAKIKDKLEDLQRFRPLLEEMLKWSKVGEKNVAARQKLQKMYEIVIGQTPCTKLSNLIRIEEAILKWTQKKKEAIKEPPVIINRLQHLKQRVAALQSLTNTESNQSVESEGSSKPTDIIVLDSSDDDEDDVQIVSCTVPEPKKNTSQIKENIPSSSKTPENKLGTNSRVRSETKGQSENNSSELEDGEIEDCESIISIVDGTGVDLEVIESEREESNFPKEKENFPKEAEKSSKESEHLYEEDEFSSLDSLESYHDKPALKTYGCRKNNKTDKNEYNDDLRSVLNAKKISKKQNKGESNKSETEARKNLNELPVATSLGKLPAEETLIIEIRNQKATNKKLQDDGVVNSNIPLREKIKNVNDDSNSSKTISTNKETEKSQSTSKKSDERLVEIVNKQPLTELLKSTVRAIEQKSQNQNLSDGKINDSIQDANKKRSSVTNENQNKSSNNDKTVTKPDESHFVKTVVEKVSEENKTSNTEKTKLGKHTNGSGNNEDITAATKGNKSYNSSLKNSTDNKGTKKDRYLDIIEKIDLTPDSEKEEDQDLDIFDEAIYSGDRRNCEAGLCKLTPDVHKDKPKVSDRKNISDKNKNIASCTLVKQNNYKGKTTTPSQSGLTREKVNPSPSSAVIVLHDSDTEEFIKKLNLAIDSSSQPKNLERTSKEKSSDSIPTNRPTIRDKLPISEKTAEKKASEIEHDPKSPKNVIQTVEDSMKQNSGPGNVEKILPTKKPILNTDNNSIITSKTPFENTTSSASGTNSTNSKTTGFKPITQEMLGNILNQVNETLKKSQSKLENTVLESEIEQDSTRNKILAPDLVGDSIKTVLNLSMELAAAAKKSFQIEAVLAQNEKLFERRPEKTRDRVTETVQKPTNYPDSTENGGSSSQDRLNPSSEENKTAGQLKDANSSVPEHQLMTSKLQLDEWANKDLSELQDIRKQLEKQLGVNLETILQADQDDESILSSDNDNLAIDAARELEEAIQDDFLNETPEPETPTFTSYYTPTNFFAQSNLPISHNLPQYLGLPPEIKPNDPRLRSRLTLLYAKTTDPMQLKLPLFKKKPSMPTVDEVLGSQAEKVQEEIRSACMKEIGELNSQIAPKTIINSHQPSTSSSNRHQARTYGEYKRLKQAAIQAETARKKAAVEAANRALQMEREAESERQKILDTEKKRLRLNEFEDSQNYETDGDIIFTNRKKRPFVFSSSSESEAQTKKSPTKQKLRKKRIRGKSPNLSSENEIGYHLSIESDTVDSTSNSAKFPSTEQQDPRSSNMSQSNALETILKNNNLSINTDNKEELKELAFTVMKSLLKENKFQEFKKLLDSSFEPNEKSNKKSTLSTASASTKGEISSRELAALNRDLHDMFIRDDVLMIGKRKSSVRSLKRIGEHYKSITPTKPSVSETTKDNSDKVVSDENADTDDFEESLRQKEEQKKKLIKKSKISPTVKLKRITQEEILKYSKVGHPDNSAADNSLTTEDDQDLLKPMKAVPFSQGTARRQSQSNRPKKDIKNINPNWHYKDPYFSKYCMFCYKVIPNLVEHYVINHPNTEVCVSRLSQNDLIYLADNPGKSKTTGEQNKKGQLMYNFKCYFCEYEMVDRFDKFSHHYAMHTGEFPYECSACDFMSCFKSVATKHTKHCKKDAKVLTYYSYDENATKINLYVCTKCNYMQLHKANVILHLRKEHECKFNLDSYVREILLLEYVEQNIEIVNEPVSTVPKADDVEIIFEIQTGSKIDLPIVKNDIESETDSVISDISIDMKPGNFELNLLASQLATTNTSVASELSGVNAKEDQIVTVVHLPASVTTASENNSGQEFNIKNLLKDLNMTTSSSTQNVEPFIVAKPKVHKVAEPTLEEPIQVKLEPEDQHPESNQKDNQTDEIKDNHINVDKPIVLNDSNSTSITSSPKEINIKEEEIKSPSEDVGVEESQDCFITVIEIVNDDEDTETDLPIKESHPESKVDEEFSPLRIEHFGYQEIRNGEFLFHCLIDKCNFGVTVLLEVLQEHATTDHDIKWSGKCNICNNEDTSTGSKPIDEELNHMRIVHIKDLPGSQNVDENYVKQLLKPWVDETKSRKHKILCEAMQSEKILHRLYKCMGDNCSFTAETKLQMSRHLADHELSLHGNPNPRRSWLECPYCEFFATKTLQVLDHIDLVHSKSIFQCSRCFYRSCSSVNLEIHHDKYHRSSAEKNTIIKCSGNVKRLRNEAARINKLAAQNIEALSCSVCAAAFVRRDIMIRHLQEAHKEIGIPKGFPMGLFSCIFCKFETDGLDQIRCHMANKHPDELLYIGVRGVGDKNIKRDIATIAHIGIEEKDDDDAQAQDFKSNIHLSELTKWDLNKTYEKFKKDVMSIHDLEKLCNPSITIDSEDESCGNEDAEVKDESTMVLYQKLIDMLKYFIKSQSGLNPCCICLAKINLEEEWSNHFKTTHKALDLNTFQVCPECPTLCSFWNYPAHYINTHNKPAKTYFCYFCGKNFNLLAAAKLHLMSHSVYEQAKLIRVKMQNDPYSVKNNDNFIDYQIILPRKFNKNITDIIKHMMGVLEKRKIAEAKIVKVPLDLDNFTIDLNENICGVNFPVFIVASMRHVCTYCNVQLTDERSFEQHFKIYHSSFKAFKCPHCEETLLNVNDFERLRDHIRIHSGIFYMCCFCKMYTSNRKYLIEHLKIYKRDSVPIVVYTRTAVSVKHCFEIIHLEPLSKISKTKIKCLFCTRLSCSPKDLGEHMRSTHEFTRQYQCDYCAFRGDEEIVDMHVINTHVKNITGNTKCTFRSKTIFQKNVNTNKFVKRKSDDLICLPISGSSIEKQQKNNEMNCQHRTENLQNSGAPVRTSANTNLPVKEFSINDPPAPSSSVENTEREITVEVPSLQELTVKDPAKGITAKEAPVQKKPVENSTIEQISKTTTFSRSLKCEFCPLKCVSNDDLLKHLHVRHGVTLLDTSESFNQEGAVITIIGTTTTTTGTTTTTAGTTTTTIAESISFAEEARKMADVIIMEPPQKKIRLVPLEKLLDPKAKGTQIEHRAPQLAPKQIVQSPQDQNLVQRPNIIYLTPSTHSQAPAASECETYVCKFTCIHCSTKFSTQEQLTAHWQNESSCPSKWSVFICYHCGNRFTSFKSLITHWGQTCTTNLLNGSYRFRISGNSETHLPDNVTSSFLEAMSKLPTSKSICFQCPECNQVYFDQQICMNHIKTKMNSSYYYTYTQEVVLYGCDQCKVFFLKEQDAIRHIAKHTFRFGCVFCQFVFKIRDELYAHYVETHRSIERSHRCVTVTEPNMEVYKEMLVVFPYGLILTKWNLRNTAWGNMENFARLIEEVNREGSSKTAV